MPIGVRARARSSESGTRRPKRGLVYPRQGDATPTWGPAPIETPIAVVADIDTVKIQLSVLWVAVALTYLLGDVLRIFAGDFKPGLIGDRPMTQEVTLGIAALFAIPIVMVVLSLNLDQPVDRWVNIAVAVLFFLLNAFGLPTYPGWYDRFLIAVSLAFNAVTIWRAWTWS